MGNCSDGSCSSGSCGGDDKDRLPPGMLSRYNLNQETGLGTLIWAERDGDALDGSVPELIGMIKDDSDDRIFAMITGDVSIKPLYNELFSYGVDTLYHIRCREMESFDASSYSEAMKDLADRIDPAVILVTATENGKALIGKIAEYYRRPVLENCASIRMEGNTLVVTRDVPDQNFKETDVHIKFPILATVRPGSHEKAEKEEGRHGTAISRPFKPSLHE